MVDIARILCPIDFSECSARALAHAAALARWYEAKVTVFHVFSVYQLPAEGMDYQDYATVPRPPVEAEDVVEQVRRFCEPLLAEGTGELAHFSVPEYHRHIKNDAMERLKALTPADVRDWCNPEEIVTSGSSYREVLRVAADAGADLIVMGVHGRGAADQALFGSTTNQVIRGACCPVLTLRT